ncbi:hypothetical protein MFRU_004g02970 [Monilinia fructicola]|nr:hypothetical protein MFRU_004g02970 [Monilinia fructicola]
MPSSSFSIPNIGTANLTAILATSSLYIYLIALHQHQQKALAHDQAASARPHAQQPHEDRRSAPPAPQSRPSDARSQRGERPPEEQEQEQEPSDGPRTPPKDHPATNPPRHRTPRRTMAPTKTFSPSEVAAHKDLEHGMYIVVDANVYDVTHFLEEHPGGSKILKRVAGKDASKQFWKYHNESVLGKYGEKLKIGVVGEKAKL